jgi:hypothetical protein
MSEECRVSEIYGEPFRFHVASFSKMEMIYLVDLEANDLAGQCSCPNWAYRLGPKIAAGERPRCRHIRAARDYAFDSLVRRLQHEMSKPRSRR